MRQCQDPLSKKLCLTVPKNFGGEPFCARFQKTSSSQKVFGQEGVWGYKNVFSRKFSFSQCRKTSSRKPSVFHKVSGIEKIMDKREGGGKQYQDFLLNVFQRRFPNILVEEPVCTVF